MRQLRLPLFLTRLSIFYFLLPWQLMRFANPDSASGIAKKYYHLPGLSDSVGLVIGVFWMALLVAFLLGFKKRISYGLVLALHVVAIIVALPYYIPTTKFTTKLTEILPIAPIEWLFSPDTYSQLFLAAIPAAAAMWLLYLLRGEDTLWSLKGKFD